MRFMTIVVALLVVPATAQELPSVISDDSDACAGEIKTDVMSRTDGGTKPNTTVIAYIEADLGYFIMVSTIETDSDGSRKATSSQLTVDSHPEITGLLEPVAALSATFRQSCRHRNIFGTSSCTAVARITAMQYPLSCLPTMISRSVGTD